jgi:hypothetical protein
MSRFPIRRISASRMPLLRRIHWRMWMLCCVICQCHEPIAAPPYRTQQYELNIACIGGQTALFVCSGCSAHVAQLQVTDCQVSMVAMATAVGCWTSSRTKAHCCDNTAYNSIHNRMAPVLRSVHQLRTSCRSVPSAIAAGRAPRAASQCAGVARYVAWRTGSAAVPC